MPEQKLSIELRKRLHGVATTVRKEMGTIIFREGQPGRGAFLIRSGKVRLTMDGTHGLYPPRTLGSGAVIGLPATLSGRPYSLTAEAKTICRLDFILRHRLLTFLRRDPQAGIQVARVLGAEIFKIRKVAERGRSS